MLLQQRLPLESLGDHLGSEVVVVVFAAGTLNGRLGAVDPPLDESLDLGEVHVRAFAPKAKSPSLTGPNGFTSPAADANVMSTPDSVLVRYGEIGTKTGGVRGRMEGILRTNVAAALRSRGIEADAERIHGRILLETDAAEAAAGVAAEIPGVVSTSPARRVAADAETIYGALATLAAERDGAFDSYAVRAHRGWDAFDVPSPELEREGGAAVGDVVDAGVDLDTPEVVFEVDVRQSGAFVFADRLSGPGGLPVGSQTPLVALVSGGIDSPVAAFEAMCRGSPVVPIYVDLGAYGGADHRARAIAACERLAMRAPNHLEEMVLVDGGDAIADLVERFDGGRMLAVRRYFFSVAEAIADAEGAVGIVTGEVLGQKSSQTAGNLCVTSAATELPIHRPLFSVDKPEIVRRAAELGTDAEASIAAGCNRLAPSRPETNGRLEDQRSAEPDDLFERAARDAAGAERVSI